MSHPLLDIAALDDLAAYLSRVGEVFRVFDQQDSGCVAYGVEIGTERWFVKTAREARAEDSLRRAVAFHAMVQHPAIIPIRHAISVAGSLALVYPWRAGEVLYHSTVPRTVDRRDPASAMARFRQRPVPDVERALAAILGAHLAVERAGLVAVDLYDGCMLYDFGTGAMALCDLDEYRPGPFEPAGQLPGSVRYMSPEEYPFRPGSVIDIRTTVYNLGRTIRLLLDAGDDELAWRGTQAQLDVVARATAADPAGRYASVTELNDAWLGACEGS
ncbi:hypothetical protein [Longispora albida]|uniref:hypothetical protein n=1 Tax=Longispora albida TaxID=203523 RepID=UPI0003692A04|nr:hypothetical protein [Longispora albida]